MLWVYHGMLLGVAGWVGYAAHVSRGGRGWSVLERYAVYAIEAYWGVLMALNVLLLLVAKSILVRAEQRVMSLGLLKTMAALMVPVYGVRYFRRRVVLAEHTPRGFPVERRKDEGGR